MHRNEKLLKNRLNQAIVKRRKIDSSSESDQSLELDDSEDSDGNDEKTCVGCGEIYELTTGTEDWMDCVVCQRWIHEGCTMFSDRCRRCGRRG
ncbi:hypothetical protein JTB14_019370 [Gonioctena quinquepunctata]|nr:hypothetical protein JTB14_019370 [Gonioctena quinquepunctata]